MLQSFAPGTSLPEGKPWPSEVVGSSNNLRLQPGLGQFLLHSGAELRAEEGDSPKKSDTGTCQTEAHAVTKALAASGSLTPQSQMSPRHLSPQIFNKHLLWAKGGASYTLSYTACLPKTVLIYHLLFFFFFWLFRAAPTAYGDSQERGPMRAAAAGLHHRQSNTRSKLRLQPTPQLTAMPDP